jgi:peptidoglycan-N-acetylglucosamine deacetylase
VVGNIRYTTLPKCLLKGITQQFPDAIFYRETSELVVALTFDDAPTSRDPGDQSTQWILDAIADYNQTISDPTFRARATFFIITSHLSPGSTIIQRIEAQGHEIANHGTIDEKATLQPPKQFEQQLRAAHQCLIAHTHQPIRWYRPGYALYNPKMLVALKQMPGYEPYFPLASMLPIDPYKLTNHPKFTALYTAQFIFPGAILLLHAGSVQRCANTTATLRILLQELRRRSYRVVTLSELWDLD